MREIDAVVVSHNHPDHNFDLGSLDDIFYEMHKRNDGAKEWTYQLFCDHESAKDFLRVARHRRLHVVGHSMKCVNNENSRIEEVYDLRKAEFGNLPIRLCFFRTKHDYPSYGVRVECLEKNKTPVSIGFTCDTEYFEDIDEKDDTDNDNLNRHLDKCDILVAHISQPTLAELVMPNEIKKGHLGYRGVAKLIRNTNPGLTLLGEFWAGLPTCALTLQKD